jgi:hypothetical protein
MKTKNKCYIIRDKKNKMLQGAFPFTKEGKIKAEKYLKKMSNFKNFEIVLQ